MKKNALRKDFSMEIRKSLNRFVSIFLIVALGVAFFSGIRATKPDMQFSADKFYDEMNMMDIEILGTLGLTADDVRALSEVEGVKDVVPSYSLDVMCSIENKQLVVKLMALTADMNEVNVKQGRLPENEAECFVDSRFLLASGYEIGDKVSFYSGTEDNMEDQLSGTEYEIVGAGDSPFYISLERGSSSIGNGEISGFVMIPESAFTLDAYTEIYLTVEGAAEETSYSEEYDDVVDRVEDRIEEIKNERCQARYDEIIKDASDAVNEAEEELNLAKQEAEEQLADAENQISEAERKLEDGRKEIEENEQKLEDGKQEIEENEQKLEDGKEEIRAGEEELEEAKLELSDREAEYYASLNQFREKEAELEAGESQIEEGRTELQAQQAQLAEQKIQLETTLEQLENSKLTPGLSPEQIAYLESQCAELKAGLNQIQEAETQIESALAEIEEKKQLLETAKEQMQAAKVQLDAGYMQLEEAKKLIDENEAKLNEAKQKILDGEKELKEGKAELEDGGRQLTEGKEELREGETELSKAREEYNDAKAEADGKIEDGEIKIADAKEEIEKIEYPEWYILDRNMLQTYVEYGQDADRIGAIGELFPVIFFLVAALVSLTTMTRMVEEQRTQIGTMKAMGYSKGAIASKYIFYALFASLGGSVAGVLIGEIFLPKVIITAYCMLYTGIPEPVTPINLYYGAMATLAAVLCTTFATIFSCYKELMAQPAQLMRPASPKLGKRVFLERLPFLWKHLNFTYKSTIRNLIRYKKRFFMTIFGIGGCMALLLVGFGLKDSIFAISDKQYTELRHYDMTVTLKDDITEEQEKEIDEYLSSNEKIEQKLKAMEFTVDAGNGDVEKSAYLFVPEDMENVDEFVVFRDRVTHEEYEISENGILITEKLASLLDVGKGDSIYIKDGEDRKIEVEITDIVENYMLHNIFMSPELYEKLYGKAVEYNEILTKNIDMTEEEEENLSYQILELEGSSNVSYVSDVKDQMMDMLQNLNVVVYVLIVSAGLLAFVVLYNLNNININERKRELATIKLLGFYDMELAQYVYRENILLTIIGTVTGIFLGIILHRYVILTAEIDLIMFGREIHLMSFLYSILLTFGFSVFVNFVMFYKLKKIDMVESLKSVE
jgi:putative ABC transport system permease protein